MEKLTDSDLLKSLRDEIEYLSAGIESGIITSVRAAEECTLKKEEYVNAVHKGKYNEIVKKNKDGTTYTMIATRPNGSRNYIRSKSKKELINKLYVYYSGVGRSSVIEDIFYDAIRWKMESKISGKSINEYKRNWEKYYKGTDFVKRDIKSVATKDWKRFFKKLCKDNELTQKKFSDVRIPINIIINYCVEEEILHYNPIRDITYDDFDFKEEVSYNNIKAKPFTDEQAKKVVEWCKASIENPKTKSIYPLAILFNFAEGLRFGELSGLQWDDIDFDKRVLIVSRQLVSNVEVTDDLKTLYTGKKIVQHLKGYVRPKPIPISDNAMYILEEIKKLRLSDEYVFPPGNFRYHTYNKKVKEAAEYAGADPSPFHTHCLRATVATNIYKATHDIKQVQYVLRHTTPVMSAKYVDDWWALDAARNAMNSTGITYEATKGDYSKK